MRELFLALVRNPTAETYRAVWGQVTTSANYDPYGSDVNAVGAMIERQRYEEALGRVHQIMPGWLLSPRLHLFAAIAHAALGDPKSAEAEKLLARRCLEGILSTGDGTRDGPYLVTCTGDEYDVLAHLQKNVVSQALAGEGDKFLDVMTCDDGAEICLDITAAFNRLGDKGKAPGTTGA